MGYFSIREKQTIRFRCNSVERVTECRTPHTTTFVPWRNLETTRWIRNGTVRRSEQQRNECVECDVNPKKRRDQQSLSMCSTGMQRKGRQ